MSQGLILDLLLDSLSRAADGLHGEHHVGPLLGAGGNTQRQGLKTELGLESWAQAEGCSQGCPGKAASER